MVVKLVMKDLKTFLVLLSLCVLLLPRTSFGYMSSTNYVIYADDFHPGVIASSTSYRLEGTPGESPVGAATGATYEILGGYQAMDMGQLSLTITDSALNLGNLNATVVSSDSTELVVFSDYSDGYILSISNTSWTTSETFGALSDTAVTAGAEEYGFAISGDDVNALLTGQDNAVSTVTLMSSSTTVSSASSTMTFKASISSSSSAGARAQTITLTLSNNL